MNRRGLFPLGVPEWPFLVTRESGRQRTAFVSAQVESEPRRAHAPEIDALLMSTVRWLGGPLQLSIGECPRSVEVRLFHHPSRRAFILLLVNLTTNPLVPSSAGPAVVRYVTPQKGIRLHLRLPAPFRSVQSPLGGSPMAVRDDLGVAVDLPELDLYECVVVEYGK